MEPKKVTVIIPVYNLEEYLEECILSVSEQTYNNLEIIVVDDGSTDRSFDLIEEFAGKDERIIPVHKENSGLSGARNAGLDIATGDYIMFVDGDDYLARDAVRKSVEILETDAAADMVFFDYERFYEKPDTAGTEAGQKTEKLDRDMLLDMLATGETSVVIACAKLYRADIWKTLRFPVGLTREDEYTCSDVYRMVDRAVHLRETLYFYRMRAGSITHTVNIKGKRDTVAAFKHRMDVLCDGSKRDKFYKFRYIEALMDLYIDCEPEERSKLKREFKEYYSMADGRILWKRRVLVLIFRISPALFVKLRRPS